MRALDSLRRFFRWRWFPFVVPVLLVLVYVLLAVWLVPESFTPASGDEKDQSTAPKGASSGSRSSSMIRSRRVSSRSTPPRSGLRKPADDPPADDPGPGAEDESPASDPSSGTEPETDDQDQAE
jgi:cell division septation protein DedD